MMNNFKGWRYVFLFTFRQATKSMAFKLVTALVSVCIIGAILLITIFSAKPDDSEKSFTVETVYILDESGLQPVDFNAAMPQESDNNITKTDFINMTDVTKIELVKMAGAKSEKAVAVYIYKEKKGYGFEILLPEKTDVSKSEAGKLLKPMVSCFEKNKLGQVGLSNQQLKQAMQPVITSYSKVGEDNSLITMLIKMLVPLLFGVVMYIMLILYGQTISKEVSVEKTSKLMEALLTSVHPYALLTGKILAVTSMALMQFAIWIAAIIAGVLGSNGIAHLIYPEYNSTIMGFVKLLRENTGESALSLPAVLLALLIFCTGFLFYCVLAGLAGSMVSKPEDAAKTQGLFQFPILISWLVCYMAALQENEGILKVVRYIPFTSPFCVPADLMTGSFGLLQGLISALLLLIFSLLVIMLSARIYKGLVLYNGQKLNLKIIGKILKMGK
jgi:ABC-2 type transport system permease protein